ncbi:pyridoxal phosphate-dependent aminotransferase [Sedimentibacter sp. MB31-C6]|uniref:pyridoxal phosphate-dependent aminotransferase n=1 Tax=Sedimentibacter sp. MB31-C6 TaxID=3109366 RepID=UPI002DDD5BA1|nr:pyridoxal phosphate-dependent aminotransferase [Sedimentibacter sp. MB36-C1]WSI05224.1 pyridoxal phosphate-dependent aminotransferase [Sedimentibacter sp. MB36-C1]
MKHRFLSKRYWNSKETAMGESGKLTNEYSDLINLSLGDPDLITDERIIDAAMNDAKCGHTHYTDFLGDLELRNEILKYYKDDYNLNYTDDEIMVTTSGCHAMWLVLEAILDDGDEVIIHEPCFTPYPQQIELARGRTVVLETYEEEEFQVNVERLEKLITNRTKALIVNTPNNPTGTCFSEDTINDISFIAKKYDLIIIADDIYTSFSYSEPFIPISSIDGMKERTITIGSFSKNFVMTGWRVGYVVAPDYIIKTIVNINENNVFTAPSVSQRAAIYALRMRKEISNYIVEEYKKRMYYSYKRICNIPNMSTLSPRGSIYLFVNIKKTGLSSTEVCNKLLDEAHILALPGNTFGSCGEGYIRLALTVSIEKLKIAFDRIEKMDIFN